MSDTVMSFSFDILLLIFGLVSPATLCSLTLVCKDFHDTCNYITKFAYRRQRLLTGYFSVHHEANFWWLQRHLGMVLCGKRVLQFLARLPVSNNELQVYVTATRAQLAVDFLVRTGFVYHKTEEIACVQAALVSIENKLNMISPHWPNRKSTKHPVAGSMVFSKTGTLATIRLVVCARSVMETVLSFPSTYTMAYATHDRVVTIFPRTTYILNKTLRVFHRWSDEDLGFWPFVPSDDGGYDLLHPSFEHAFPSGSELGVYTRKIGDAHCWVRRYANPGEVLPPAFHPRILPEVAKEGRMCTRCEYKIKEPTFQGAWTNGYNADGRLILRTVVKHAGEENHLTSFERMVLYCEDPYTRTRNDFVLARDLMLSRIEQIFCSASLLERPSAYMLSLLVSNVHLITRRCTCTGERRPHANVFLLFQEDGSWVLVVLLTVYHRELPVISFPSVDRLIFAVVHKDN
ncbi:hypothetical protein VKT23_009987 [Stygiomarasmius scandens]|uniref:F-box domain-containing protein n=1 Tax=Marasmiellus scandens TaxID=2682957 RepID=A0ABR1JIK1_9AGAR